MKNFILINNHLSNNFWTKVIEAANYFYNKLPIKNKNYSKIIPKKAKMGWQQDLGFLYIFGSLVFAKISETKRLKSDYQKN